MPITDICIWPISAFQVGCVHGELRVIEAREIHYGNFQLAYLPQSLRRLKIFYCEQSGTIEARHLPANAREINLNGNFYSGSIRLCDLPPWIEDFSAARNALSGTIDARDLPRLLRTIDLSHNALAQPVLYCHNIPKNFWFFDAQENQIREVRALSVEDDERVHWMFQCGLMSIQCGKK